MMYRWVSQLVLLYGNEIWVVVRAMLKVLEGFHHRVASIDGNYLVITLF